MMNKKKYLYLWNRNIDVLFNFEWISTSSEWHPHCDGTFGAHFVSNRTHFKAKLPQAHKKASERTTEKERDQKHHHIIIYKICQLQNYVNKSHIDANKSLIQSIYILMPTIIALNWIWNMREFYVHQAPGSNDDDDNNILISNQILRNIIMKFWRRANLRAVDNFLGFSYMKIYIKVDFHPKKKKKSRTHTLCNDNIVLYISLATNRYNFIYCISFG